VEKCDEAIALLDCVSLLEIGIAKSARESGHVANRPVATQQFTLVIGQAYRIEIGMSRGVIADAMSLESPLPD
jgi:hypothetical protein